MSFVRSLIVVIGLASVAWAQTTIQENSNSRNVTYVSIDSRELSKSPDRYLGHLVSLTGEIISISAEANSLHLFDGRGPDVISVSLSHLKKSSRRALANEPVHRVAVFGRINRINGRITLEADRIERLEVVEIVDIAGLTL